MILHLCVEDWNVVVLLHVKIMYASVHDGRVWKIYLNDIRIFSVFVDVLYVCVCMCLCVCGGMCVCVYVCVGRCL